MSVLRTWQGGAAARQQTMTITAGSGTAAQTFTVQLEHPSGSPGDLVTVASYTAGGSDTAAKVASALYYLLTTGSVSGSTGTGTGTANYLHHYNTRISYEYTAAGTTILMRALYAGEPYLVTVGGTGTISVASNVENSGPNDWYTPGNWVEGIIPVDNDDIILTGNFSILYGLNQIGVTVDTIQTHNFNGKVGSRSTPLIIEPTDEVRINSPACEFHMRGDSGATLALLTIDACMDSSFGKGSGGYSATAVYVNGGRCIFGFDRGTAPSATSVYVNGGRFECYRGQNITNLYQTGGEAYVYDIAGAVTLWQIDGGSAWIDYFCGATTVLQNGGVFYFNSESTTTLYTLSAGLLDATQNRKASKAITTLTQSQAGVARFDTGHMTVSTWNRSGPMETKGIGTARAA